MKTVQTQLTPAAERALKMALLPGMQFMKDQVTAWMQSEIDRVTAEINGTAAGQPRLKADGTPDMRSVRSGRRPKSGWPDTPEERSAEMIRRRKVTLAKRLKAELPERMSTAGLRHGSRAYKDVLAHNKRMERAERRAVKPVTQSENRLQNGAA